MNVDQLFQEVARCWPHKPAILAATKQPSYGQLNEAISKASRQLRAAGIGPGSCVAIHLPSGIPYIVWTFAVWRCGGCAVPVAVELVEPEKQQICRDIAVDYLLGQGQQQSAIGFAQSQALGPAQALGNETFLQRLTAVREHPNQLQHINAAFIRFTSGTTGNNKGVVLSHESIYERILGANQVLQIGPQDRIVWLLSMSYHFTVSIVGYLILGAAVILPPNNFAAAVYCAAQKYNATLSYGSPMHYALLADYPEGKPIASWRLAISTAAPLDVNIAQRFQGKYQLPITQALGIIEVGLPCVNIDFAASCPSAVGRVLPAYELRLSDVGLGHNVGEMWLKGPGMLDAYYDPWQPRDQLLCDGWFHTGDIAEIDHRGCVLLRGRSTDVINVLGMKLFPQQVEAVLREHAMVHDACVVAESHPRLGEVPIALVQLEVGTVPTGQLEKQLKQHCRQHLADYKVPHAINFVEHLPRTASGKLLHRMRAGDRP